MATSPFFVKPRPLQAVMLHVCAALLPAVVVYVATFGIGMVVQMLLATLTALATEAWCLSLRRYPLRPFLLDGSSVLTAWLLALSIPPLAPWWMVVLATFIAIGLAKHLYGGLGQNTFNPAMVGFAVLMVSFPAQMSHWAAPLALPQPDLNVGAQLQLIFTGHLPAALSFDSVASATPLDTIKTGLIQHLQLADILRAPIFGAFAGQGSQWINVAYLLGGLYLLALRLIPWQLPVAFLAGFGLIAGGCYWIDPQHYVSPVLHFFSGATMLGAFFIVTDPVTGPTTALGRWIFAGTIGFLVYLIRVFGGYPDGVAFAVLIMNVAGPFIDQYTQSASFGRKAWEKAQKKT